MKLYRKSWIIFLMVIMVSLVSLSCDEDDSKKESKVTSLKEDLETSTWVVAQYFDEQDETHHFSGYVFTFNDDGTVSAVKDASAVNGTWSVSSSSNDIVKVDLDFGTINPFDELTDDWDVTEHTDNVIRLQDVSGGSGETDLLTFERN